MARASAIWVIQEQIDYEQFDVLAAFTVKHELITWMKKHNITDDTIYSIYKTGDGIWQTPTTTEWLETPSNCFKPSEILESS